jgi:hypothetical protein
METNKNKPKEKIRVGRITLLKWENTNSEGEVFTTFSLNKTQFKRDESNPSRFEGQVFSLNGLTKNDLESIKNAVEEALQSEGWSQ